MRKLLIVFIISISVLFAQNQVDVDKGLTYYKFIIKPMLGMNGSTFSYLYTKKEWEFLFQEDAKEFKQVFQKKSLEFDAFTTTPKFKKILPYLKAFVINYAKDSGHSPHCGNDEIDN